MGSIDYGHLCFLFTCYQKPLNQKPPVHEVTLLKNYDRSFGLILHNKSIIRDSILKKSSSFLPYKTFLPVTTCTLARWLRKFWNNLVLVILQL